MSLFLLLLLGASPAAAEAPTERPEKPLPPRRGVSSGLQPSSLAAHRPGREDSRRAEPTTGVPGRPAPAGLPPANGTSKPTEATSSEAAAADQGFAPATAEAASGDAGLHSLAFPLCPPFPRLDRSSKDGGGAAAEPPPDRSERWGIPPEPQVELPEDPLQPASRNSSSLGRANGGRLLRPAVLARRGKHHRMLPGKGPRRYGTEELVQAVIRAARLTASEHPGSMLGVGNLSRGRGGRIPVSVSHQSGRDVDLAFFAVDAASGKPVQPRHFSAYGADGLSADRKLRFDAPRNWAVVEALVTDSAPVQWIFVADWLRELLLEEAQRQKAPPVALARAELVLRQPLGSSAHDDHFHVRYHCSSDDIMDGCRDFGPRRPWAPFPESAFAERVEGLRRLLLDREAPRRRRLAALERVELLQASEVAPALVALLEENDQELGLRTLSTLRVLEDSTVAPALLQRLLRPETPVELVAAGLDALEVLAPPELAPGLLALVRDERPLPGSRRRARRSEPAQPTRVGERVLQVVARLAAPQVVPQLIGQLEQDGDLGRRRQVALALTRIANIAEPDRQPGESEAAAWARWWEAHRTEPRAAWLREGMEQAGYRLPFGVCAVDSIRVLTPALHDERRHIRENARDMIRAIVNMGPWRPGDRTLSERYWRRWWRKTGQRAARIQEELWGAGGVAAGGDSERRQPAPASPTTDRPQPARPSARTPQ